MEPPPQAFPPRESRAAPTARSRWQWPVAALLFAATFFTATTLGAAWYLFTRADVTTDLLPWLTPGAVRRVWTEPALLRAGLNFSIPTLLILLCHELGHYLACRRYRLPATPPMFLPAPFGLGTLGAFIRIRAPIRSKRQLFDVGVSGPIAGFVALLPFLIYGLMRSEAVPISTTTASQATAFLLVPGQSLAIRLLVPWLRGPVPPGAVLDLHPWALAAWVGLLATALNLLPLGQLDGGHVLYAAVGRLQRWLALPLLGLLVLAGFRWGGWWIWCVLILVMGPFHPRVVDESQPLDPRRRLLALIALVLFVLCFMPTPLAVLPVSAG